MTTFLMFRLYGPMASWGDMAVGEQRPSHSYPSKSAVLGLVAAALGIRRDEEARQLELFNGYALAIRVDSEGSLLRDYHTVQVPPPQRGRRYFTRRDEMNMPRHVKNTILSQRDYRVDAHYTVILTENNAPYPLKDIAQALLNPRFALYLGRKSCPPAFPLQPFLVEAENLAGAFEQYPVANAVCDFDSLSTTNAEKIQAFYWEGMSLAETGLKQTGVHMIQERRDHLSSRKRWQFVNRKEQCLLLNEEGMQ